MSLRKSLCVLSLAALVAPAALAQPQAAAPPLTLSSPAFADGAAYPVQFTPAAPGAKAGEGVSPPLVWSNAPATTKSFVLHMEDLDNAINRGPGTQIHWLVWNIPATSTGLTQGQPSGAQLPDGSSQTSATGLVYRGPGAPASGPIHHYVFELYALDIPKVDVTPTDDEQQNRTDVFAAIAGHIVAKAVYTTTYRTAAGAGGSGRGAGGPAAAGPAPAR
jgi:Raf kinase inhibitor-like YbhB/YbcL family protein